MLDILAGPAFPLPMTYQAILSASLFLLGIYAVERICRALALPSVIALITGGLLARPALDAVGISLEWAGDLVPLLGTVGLVMIVLEGALDMELRRNRLRLLIATFAAAALGFLACLIPLAWLAATLLELTPVHALLLATPFAVISSAVAIPASAMLSPENREFVVYESAMSDILGVIVFFSLLGAEGSVETALLNLTAGGLISLLLSLLCALALVWLLHGMDGPIRYVPLLAGLFALYATGKLLHLSPLFMVLLLGLLLNNPHLLRRIPVYQAGMDENFRATVTQFHSLVAELTFVVRGFFFVLLGYWTDLYSFVNPGAWGVALTAGLVIYLGRYPLLRLLRSRRDAHALTWMAPRGLITVLLFLTVRDTMMIPDYFTGAVLLLVLISALLMVCARAG
jgi:NhaP-type Na+/H+ or K+/H+ antiporter